jgi:hypothetical protein
MARRTKKILIYSGIAAVLATTFFFLYSHFKDKLIRDTVQEQVNGKNGLYKITYDSLYLDEVNGELFVTNLKVTPDTGRFRGRDMTSDDPLSLVAISAEKLHITGVKTPQALLNKEVTGSRIFISNVDVTLFKLRNDTGSEKNESLESIMYNDVLSRLKLIKVDTISVEHVNFRMANFRKNKEVFAATNTSVTLYNTQIDSSSVSDSSRILFSKNISVQIEQAEVKSRNGHYKYSFSNIEVNSFSRSLHLNEIKMTPAFGESQFMLQLKTQNDRFDFNLKDISIKGVDFSKVSIPALVADSLLVGQSSFKIFRDLNVPRDSVSRLDQYPHQVIMKMPFDLTIRKAVLRNSFIEYKERNNKSKNSGKVQFQKVTAYIDNITNAKESLQKNNICTLDFNSSFLNRAPLKARLVMRLGDKQGRFTIKGSLGRINVADLNALTEPMGLAKMDKGVINKMEFDITATKYKANGSLLLLYDDLKVSLLKKDDDNNYKKKGFASFAANAIVINANPQKDKTRIARIDYDRDINRSFFNMIWKSIFSGIKESVGMKL